MNTSKPAARVVMDMVEGYIEAASRLAETLES
jgi:hypothetical protein